MSSNGELGSAGQNSRSLGLPGVPLNRAVQLFLHRLLPMSRNITTYK